MQKVPLPMAQPGMVLEKPVTRANGMTLIGAGTELTESLIQRLENMGIESVIVRGSPLAATDGKGPYDEKIERLDYLFRQYEADPWMKKVKAALVGYYQNKAMLESGTGQDAGEDNG